MAAAEADSDGGDWDDWGWDDWGWDDLGWDDWGDESVGYDVYVHDDTHHQDWDPNWDTGDWWHLDPPEWKYDPDRRDWYTEDFFGKDRIEYDRNYGWDERDVMLNDHTASGFERGGGGGGGG